MNVRLSAIVSKCLSVLTVFMYYICGAVMDMFGISISGECAHSAQIIVHILILHIFLSNDLFVIGLEWK